MFGTVFFKYSNLSSEKIFETKLFLKYLERKKEIVDPIKTPEKVNKKVSKDPRILATNGITGAMVMGKKITEMIIARKYTPDEIQKKSLAKNIFNCSSGVSKK